MEDSRQRFDPEKLKIFSSKALQKVGVPKNDADITAKILIDTDLRGIESHGIAHLGIYIYFIKKGLIKSKPVFSIKSHSPSTAVMDDNSSLGFIAGYYAMKEAIKKAKKTGCGFVSVRNSTHFGAASPYAMMALEHNMIGISMSAGGRLMMAPGSSSRAGGLNPLGIAIPSGRKHPFVLDMSTSVIANSKIEIAKRQGKSSIPEGYVIDDKGNAVTDLSKIKPEDSKWKGGLLPLGGKPETGSYKGFGLALVIDILCTLLSGAPINSESNHFFGAMLIDGFRKSSEFMDQMDRLIDSIETLPTISGVKKVYVPGGHAMEKFLDRTTNGIPLDKEVIRSLKDLSRDLKIKFDF